MAKELVPSQKKSILAIMAEHYNLDPDKFTRVIKATCGLQRASDEEFTAFIEVAHEYKLNPLTREIYAFVKSPERGGGIQPIVGVDGWIKKMNEHPAHDGVETHEHLEDGHLVATTATIYRKDRAHPTQVTEFLHECRRNTDPWKQMPARMLRHKALIQCIRVAYNLLPGAMDEDEAEAFELKEGADGVFRAPDLPRIRPPGGSGAAAGSASTERVNTSPPQDGGRRKAQEHSDAAPTPPPLTAGPEDKPISSDRQKDLVEQGDLAGMKSSQVNQYALSKYGVALNKITESQADEIEQYFKSRGAGA